MNLNLETGTQGMSVSVSMTRVETNDETLDEHLFIEALAFCSLQSKAFETDAKPIEKVIPAKFINEVDFTFNGKNDAIIWDFKG